MAQQGQSLLETSRKSQRQASPIAISSRQVSSMLPKDTPMAAQGQSRPRTNRQSQHQTALDDFSSQTMGRLLGGTHLSDEKHNEETSLSIPHPPGRSTSQDPNTLLWTQLDRIATALTRPRSRSNVDSSPPFEPRTAPLTTSIATNGASYDLESAIRIDMREQGSASRSDYDIGFPQDYFQGTARHTKSADAQHTATT